MSAVFAIALAGGLATMRVARRACSVSFVFPTPSPPGSFWESRFFTCSPRAPKSSNISSITPSPRCSRCWASSFCCRWTASPSPNAGERRKRRPWIILAPLSVHSLVVGVALGLEPGLIGSLALFAAILFHKASDAFALIVNAHSGGVSAQRQRAMLAFFSTVTPAGIAVGSLLSDGAAGEGAATAAAGSVGAFATGTLAYVAIVIIVDRDAERPPLSLRRAG